MKKLLIAGLFLMAATGCPTKPINESAAAIQLMNEAPPAGCKEKGQASVTGVGPFFQNSLRTKLKNEAALLGGNYVKVEPVQGSASTLTGTVFLCP